MPQYLSSQRCHLCWRCTQSYCSSMQPWTLYLQPVEIPARLRSGPPRPGTNVFAPVAAEAEKVRLHFFRPRRLLLLLPRTPVWGVCVTGLNTPNRRGRGRLPVRRPCLSIWVDVRHLSLIVFLSHPHVQKERDLLPPVGCHGGGSKTPYTCWMMTITTADD